jgi:CBS domain-containing protein
MNVGKIMREDVVALRPEEAIEPAWRKMRNQGLGALPVTDATGQLVGLLTENDLLVRLAPRRAPRWWNMFVDGTDLLAAECQKTTGITVEDVMTAAPVMVEAGASLEAAAVLMREHAIDTLPVIGNDHYVGLVTRADILDHLSWPAAAAPGSVNDVELGRRMHERLERELWVSRHCVTVEAVHGVIRLTGVLASPVERSALLAMARAIPGCAGVDDRLIIFCRWGRQQPARTI